LNYNAEHGITNPKGVVTDAPGVEVKYPNGSSVPDKYNSQGDHKGVMVGPTSDLSGVAAAGRNLKKEIDMLIAEGDLERAKALLYSALATNVATGGNFDYQRHGPQSDLFTGGFEQFRTFRDVSNFNVGLFAQQAGLNWDETISFARVYAFFMSSNARGSYTPDARNYEMTREGYEAGASGVYGQ
jgi:hypothetical protein